MKAGPFPAHAPAVRSPRRAAFYVAACVVAALWAANLRGYSLRRAAAPRPPHPSLACTGADADSRRCVVTGAIYSGGIIYLEPEETATGLPGDVLCSVANNPNPVHRRMCTFKVATDSEWRIMSAASEQCELDVGVALHRLNPKNAYHTILEDVVPFYGMLQEVAGVGSDPGAALDKIKSLRVGLLVTDGYGVRLDRLFWATFLPEIVVLHPHMNKACFVKRLVAGTRGRCAHWGHCLSADGAPVTFSPRDAAIDFRALALTRLGVAEDRLPTMPPPAPPAPPAPDGEGGPEGPGGGEPAAAGGAAGAAQPAPPPPPPPPPPPRADFSSLFAGRKPRVLVVQRNTTRKISNIRELSDVVERVTGAGPKVVDFVKYSIHKQVRVVHDADIAIMVHGGALAHMIWLPFGAELIDIYPYTFPAADQSQLTHWVRHALLKLELLHHPFESTSSDDQELLLRAFDQSKMNRTDLEQVPVYPLPHNCRCSGPHRFTCQAETFWRTARVRVDPVAFEAHLRTAVNRWQRHDFDPPCDSTKCFERLRERLQLPSKQPDPSLPECMHIP